MLKRIISFLACAALAVAFIIGHFASRVDYLPLLQEAYPEATVTAAAQQSSATAIFELLEEGASAPVTVLVNEGSSFGGPLVLAVFLKDGPEAPQVEKVEILASKDTPAYIEQLEKKHFFPQFASKSIAADFISDGDIDSVSGATVSSASITHLVRAASHGAALDFYGLEATWKADPWSFKLVDGGLALLIGLVLLTVFVRTPMTNRIALAIPYISLAFVGFYLNAAMSIGSIGGAVMGYFPDPKTNLAWWIITVPVLIMLLGFGRNIYCNRICPFYAVQLLLNKLGGFRFNVHPKFAEYSKTIVLGLVWLSLMLIFLSRHPAYGAYEPFSMAFSLNGVGVQWYILPLALFGAMFVPTFWCRNFCPVGFSLNKVVNWRSDLMMKVKSIGKPKPAPSQAFGGAAFKGFAPSAAMAAQKPKLKPGTGVFTGMAALTLAFILGYFGQSLVEIVNEDVFQRAQQNYSEGSAD